MPPRALRRETMDMAPAVLAYVDATGVLTKDMLIQSILISIPIALLTTLIWVKLWMETLERFAFFLIVMINTLLPVVCLLVGAKITMVGMEDPACTDISCSTFWWAIGLAVFAVLQLMWLCCIWSKISLTSQILMDVCSVVTDAPGSILVAYVMVLVMVAWYAICGLAILQAQELFGAYAEEEEMSATGAGTAQFWLTALLMLMLFWGHETFRMISHVTTCGVVASWYFFPHLLKEGTPCCRPATCDSLRRACTSAFGSIAFGALILAFFDLLQYLVQKAFDQVEKAGDNAVVKCVRYCVTACMACIKKCMEWLTDYAFVYIAIYGISFIEAGLEVKDLVVSKGLDAIAQTTLIAPVLYLGKALGGLLGGVVCVCSTKYLLGDDLGDSWLPAFTTGVIVSVVAVSLKKKTLESGTKTLFVCYAEEPQVMREMKPSLAEEMDAATKLQTGTKSDLVVP
eukprot:Transcript_1493.p1 GENE.Transcript_1493~~Transcript_1493.p1  ORF type:complete len:457 (+),score=240.48 Transcript_1493:398-1768(+)